MRRIIITTLALTFAFTAFGDTEAEAARRRFRNRGTRRIQIFQRQESSGNLLSNLMDLERRKNAWLRSTFMGR